MGFCRICFIGYMLCTYIVRTERNYHSQWIIVRKILICVHSRYSCFFLLVCEQNIKVYFTRMFSGKITIKYIFIGVILLFAGIFDSYCYSFIAKTDVFKNIYSTVISLLTSCIYLLITAFVEEIAWRGFLLERLSFKKINCVLLLVPFGQCGIYQCG